MQSPNKAVSKLSAFYFHEPFTQNFWPDILEEIYKKQVYRAFLPTKKQGKICVDLGANVGLTSYYFSEYFEKVYAVEPASLHLEALRAMIKQNRLTNIEVVPYAMSNENSQTRFYKNDNQTMFSLESMVNKKDDYEEVQTISIGRLFEKYMIDHIDLLKLDVEGSEGKVIASEEFTNYAPKIKVICGEWHEWAALNKEHFQHIFEQNGYHFRWRHDTQAAVFEAVRI